MANNPFITLFIKGLKSELIGALIKESQECTMLDFNALYPVPDDASLLELYFSSRVNLPEDVDIKKLKSLWKEDNWGIDVDLIPVDECQLRDDFILLHFRVHHSAPVGFISYLTETYNEVFIYLGFNDMYNPDKYSFIGNKGNVWPLKSGPMLCDFKGDAVFVDKYGDYRYSKTNELAEIGEINFHGSGNFLNHMLFHLIR
jgi:hypothetical protein